MCSGGRSEQTAEVEWERTGIMIDGIVNQVQEFKFEIDFSCVFRFARNNAEEDLIRKVCFDDPCQY